MHDLTEVGYNSMHTTHGGCENNGRKGDIKS